VYDYIIYIYIIILAFQHDGDVSLEKVNVMSWLLYPWGTSPRYSMNRRLGVPQSLSGYFIEGENFLALSGMEPRVVHPLAW
jgi:hypothetical protein